MEFRTRPPSSARVITASATPFAEGACRAIWVDVTGDITLTMEDGTSATFANVVAGIWHPFSARALTAATATGIKAGW